MRHYGLLSALAFLLTGALNGCSPLQQGRDLGDPAAIEDAPAAMTVQPGEALRVVAKAVKPIVELGEPVYLTLRASNTGERPIEIVGRLRPGDGLVKVFSSRDQKDRRLLAPLSESDYEGGTILAPGQTHGDVFPIFFGAGGWYFTEAGSYRISAEVIVRRGGRFFRVSSDPVTLRVTASEAGSALLDADEPVRVESGKFLLWRSGDHLEQGIEFLSRLVEQYPDTALSAYINAALAHHHREPFANYLKGEVRPPDCRRADRLARAIDTTVLPDNLLIENQLARAKCRAADGRWPQADEALAAARRLTGNRPEYDRYRRTIATMQKALDARSGR